jgi:hypothetical protein
MRSASACWSRTTCARTRRRGSPAAPCASPTPGPAPSGTCPAPRWCW